MKSYKLLVQKLVEQYSSNLTEIDVAQAQELIAAGEEQIAFENLCERISDRGIRCTEQQFADIKTIAETLKIQPRRWEFLNPKEQ